MNSSSHESALHAALVVVTIFGIFALLDVGHPIVHRHLLGGRDRVPDFHPAVENGQHCVRVHLPQNPGCCLIVGWSSG